MSRDAHYISALLKSKQSDIADAYKAMKKPFIAFVRSHCNQLESAYLEDVYHEAFIRLQQNILQGKLTADNLVGTLTGYLQGIGFNVAMEMVRKHHEIVEGSAAWDAMLNSLEQQACMEAEERGCGLSALWEMEVEERFNTWCKAHPDATRNERNACFDKLTEEFLNHHQSRREIIDKEGYTASFDTMDDVLTRERDKILRHCVEQMKAPCAPLLLGAIWDEKTNAELTIELGYANEESTKNQKSRCLKKLKLFIKPLLKRFGYDYE